MPRVFPSPKKRLLAKIKKNRHTKCWEFTSSRDRKGYCRFFYKGKPWWAHRAAWEILVGPIPDQMDVLHLCDNPVCINPNHLFVGNHTDNMRDMFKKGRRKILSGDNHPSRKNPSSRPRGERNGFSKLTTEQVLAIRADTRTQHVISKDYNVDQTCISLIKRRKNWRHI